MLFLIKSKQGTSIENPQLDLIIIIIITRAFFVFEYYKNGENYVSSMALASQRALSPHLLNAYANTTANSRNLLTFILFFFFMK